MMKMNYKVMTMCAIMVLCFSAAASATQMAIWTFDNPVGGTDAVTATNTLLQGMPTITLLLADIDDNGKGGTTYTDVEGVSYEAAKAAAWDDVAKSGDNDAQWICAISTTGFEDISIRFDYMGNDDDPIESLDLDYRINGGEWVEVENNYAIDGTDVWKIFSYDYSAINAIENQTLVEFRFDDLESGDSNGDFRFDNFEVTGTAVPEPATFALFSLGGLLLKRKRQVA